jgi:hypothetical protein
LSSSIIFLLIFFYACFSIVMVGPYPTLDINDPILYVDSDMKDLLIMSVKLVIDSALLSYWNGDFLFLFLPSVGGQFWHRIVLAPFRSQLWGIEPWFSLSRSTLITTEPTNDWYIRMETLMQYIMVFFSFVVT